MSEKTVVGKVKPFPMGVDEAVAAVAEMCRRHKEKPAAEQLAFACQILRAWAVGSCATYVAFGKDRQAAGPEGNDARQWANGQASAHDDWGKAFMMLEEALGGGTASPAAAIVAEGIR